MTSRRSLTAVLATALAFQPAVAAAQQAACITEGEVSAMAIYSVPSLVQSVRLRCGAELSANGYVARRGDALIGRYTALQGAVWPRAKSGLLKIFAAKSAQGRQSTEMFATLPDNAVRPLVDALIVQELSPKIAIGNCGRIERVIEAAAPIDPEIAGTLLGVVAGVVNPEQVPICPGRRT